MTEAGSSRCARTPASVLLQDLVARCLDLRRDDRCLRRLRDWRSGGL